MESYVQHSGTDTECIGRRKDRKVLVEKRRRARINQCLTEIKHIVCGSQKQTDSTFENIEKAEILESTVNYLKNVRKITTTPQQFKETIKVRFQQGYSRCAEEILTYIQSLPGASDNVQHQLRKHLNGRVSRIQHGKLQPVLSQNQHALAHAYMNSSVRTSVRREASLEDSGYEGCVESLKFSKELLKSVAASDLELLNRESTTSALIFKESRVNAWVQTTLSYCPQFEMKEQSPWRPW